MFGAFFASVTARIALAGAVFGGIFPASLFGMFSLAEAHLLEGMVALAIGLPVAVGVFLLSIAIAAGAALFILPSSLGKARLFIIILGVVLAIEASAGIRFAWPQLSVVPLILALTAASVIVFMVAGVIARARIPKAAYIVLAIIMVIGVGATAFPQYQAGTTRLQIHGLKNAGFDIYIPAKTSGLPRVEYAQPKNERSDGYADGVKIQLTRTVKRSLAGPFLMEYRFKGDYPAEDCSNNYGNIYKHPLDSGVTYRCTLVSDTAGKKVYLQERTYQSNDSVTPFSQTYFAIVGTTEVWASTIKEFDRDAQGNVTADEADPSEDNNIELSKQILESLTIAPPDSYADLVIRR